MTNFNPLKLKEEIKDLKKSKNAIILAHYYQENDVQDIGDYIGDSLGLSQQAEQTEADIILFAGVVFMAETAKMLNPTKKVLVPDLNAGCSLADNCPADKFKLFIESRPDHVVVSYINCSAEVKALSDIICTSSNAEKIIRSIPLDKKIIFGPDKHLGDYLIKKTGRDMVLWDGACEVHDRFNVKQLTEFSARHPNAKIIAHPECPADVLEFADFIGSTTALLNYTIKSDANSFIVLTEAGILHQMQKASPSKIFIALPNQEGCNCAECPYMRLNTLEKIKMSLIHETPEIILDDALRIAAYAPIKKMLELSRQ